jgi:hypothetical protein
MVHPKPPKSQTKTRQPSVGKPQPRIELRCIDCDCSEESAGKLLGVLLGVDGLLHQLLRAAGVKLQLPCQKKKSKLRIVPL